MTTLQERIITYVTKVDALVSLEKLIAVSSAVGFSEGEVLAALSGIGNKLKSTVRGGVVYYQVPPPPKTPTDHLAWVNANYPRPAKCEHGVSCNVCEHCMPFPSISYAHLFLKPAELLEYKAQAKGYAGAYVTIKAIWLKKNLNYL